MFQLRIYSLASTAALLTILSFSACQKKSEKFSYDMTQNGCATGQHEFSNKADYCASLKDDRANGFCALSMRRDRYHAECGNDF